MNYRAYPIISPATGAPWRMATDLKVIRWDTRWRSEMSAQWQVHIGNHLVILYIGSDVDVVKKDWEIP